MQEGSDRIQGERYDQNTTVGGRHTQQPPTHKWLGRGNRAAHQGGDRDTKRVPHEAKRKDNKRSSRRKTETSNILMESARSRNRHARSRKDAREQELDKETTTATENNDTGQQQQT